MNATPPVALPNGAVAAGPKHTRAFTLIELLTVITIIGILASIIIPVTGRVRDSAREAQCISNLRQLGSAAMMFSDDNKDYMPDLNWWSQELLPYTNATNPYKDLFWCSKATKDENPLDSSRNLSRYTTTGDLIPIAYGINGNYPSNDGHIPAGNFGSKGRRRSNLESPSRVMLFAEQVGGYANLFYNNPDRFSHRHSRAGAASGRMQINVVYVDASAKRIDMVYDTNSRSDWRLMFDPR